MYFNNEVFFLWSYSACSPNYNLVCASVEANGAACGALVFFHSNLYRAMVQNDIGLLPWERLPDEDKPIPCFLVCDDASALKDWVMKLFPHRGLTREERVFNYHLSRARRVVENAFGIPTIR